MLGAGRVSRLGSQGYEEKHASVAVLEDDSFNDICDQIRMLRAAVLPEALRGGRGGSEGPSRRFGGASSPSSWPSSYAIGGADEWTPMFPATSSGPSSQGLPRPPPTPRRQPTGATSSGDAAAGGGGGVRRQLQKGGAAPTGFRNRSPGSIGGDAFASPRKPAAGGRKVLSGFRACSPLRPTLWEERQMARCFSIWSRWCRAGAPGNPPNRTSQRELTARNHDLDSAPHSTGRLDLSFRAWQRLCATSRTEEIAMSVQVMNRQVSLQMRRSLARWRGSIHADMSRRTRQQFRVFLRRRALQRWHRTVAASVLQNQACALLRVQQLRKSVRRWAERVPARRLNNLAEQEKERTMCNRTRRSVLKWWGSHARVSLRQRRTLAQRQRRFCERLIRSAMRRLAQNARVCRMMSARQKSTERQASITVFRLWSLWSTRRRQLQSILCRHLSEHVWPQCLREAFHLWVTTFRREQRHQSALQRASIVTAIYLKGRMFRDWLSITRLTSAALAHLRSVMFSVDVSFFASLFICWRCRARRGVLVQQRVASLEEESKQRICLLSYGCWRSWASRKVRHRLLLFDREAILKQKICFGCLRTMREYAECRQLKSQLKAQAMIFHTHRLTARHIRCWRTSVLSERTERRQYQDAKCHDIRRLMSYSIAQWRKMARANRREREHAVVAEDCRSRYLRKSVVTCWYAYAARRKANCHSAAAQRCSAALAAVRSRRHLRSWAVLQAARRHGQFASLTSVRRTAGRFFTWRLSLKAEKARAEQVRVARRRRHYSNLLSRWAALLRATQFYKASGKKRLFRWVITLWRRCAAELLARAEAKVSEGHVHQRRRLIYFGFAWWLEGLLCFHEMRSRTARLLETFLPHMEGLLLQQRALSLRCWWSFIEDSRSAEALHLQEDCFQCWFECVRRQNHKRSVHVLCDQYRNNQATRKALSAWRTLRLHRSTLSAKVRNWSAEVATQRVLLMLRLWRECTMRGRDCRQALATLTEKKRALLLGAWRCALVQKLALNGVVEHMSFERKRLMVHAWKERIDSWRSKRKKDTVLIQLVRQSRQLWWVDRWRQSGKLFRLANRAKACYGQTMGRQLARKAMLAWWAARDLLTRGGAAAERIGGKRASKLISAWAELKRILGVRPRRLVQQAIKGWTQSHAQRLLLRQAVGRFSASVAAPGFYQLKAYWETRARRRRDFTHNASALERGLQILQRRRAVGTWRSFAKERTRERALENLHVPPRSGGENDDLQKVERLQEKLRHRWLLRWHEAWLNSRVRSLHHVRPALADFASGLKAARHALQAFKQHVVRQKESRELQDRIRSKVMELKQARFFKQWYQKYEHEASSYFASLILIRWQTGRIVSAWRRLAAQHRQAEAKVDQVRAHGDSRRLHRLWHHWIERVKIHRIAKERGEHQQHQRAARILAAWRMCLRQTRTLRRGLHDFRHELQLQRGRRCARQMCLGLQQDLTRVSFQALSSWTRKALALRARCSSLQKKVVAARKVRRFCGWLVHSREQRRVQDSAAAAFHAWVSTHQRERFLAQMAHRCHSLLAKTVLGLWFKQVSEDRRFRLLIQDCRTRRAVRDRIKGFARWRTRTQVHYRYRYALWQHLSRWTPRKLQPHLAIWKTQARRTHLIAEQSAGRNFRQVWSSWHAWVQLAASGQSSRRRGAAACGRMAAVLTWKIVQAWLAYGRKRSGVRRLCKCFSECRRCRRWVREQEWTTSANSDPALRTMFHRFAEAFDQHRLMPTTSSGGGRRSLAEEGGAFEALVSLIWARQQTSVAMGRLKGYPQPWILGAWPADHMPLLTPANPYHTQAEMRLARMVSQLEAQREATTGDGRSSRGSSSLVRLLVHSDAGATDDSRDLQRSPHDAQAADVSLQQRLLMWRALADLLVVHHPGWPVHDTSGPAYGAAANASPDWLGVGTARRAASPCWSEAGLKRDAAGSPPDLDSSSLDEDVPHFGLGRPSAFRGAIFAA